MKVVDASVALKWFKQEGGSDESRTLLLEELLLAPELILAEVLNAARKAARHGLMTSLQADIVFAELPLCVVLLEHLAPLATSAAQAARQLGHPVYDCFYPALADREGVPLVTADTRLATKVTGTRWSDLVLPLQPSAISR